ncbi:uncharacterized protein LOC124928990 [Impatiens glandulifera]|uniref:uncharacterized protein LOC124928990 n=1 Tax=Impatiens glandulifera TaxID=253017 RepID=UPI001FB11FEB|nr:uncharacterized protein LOC124928990 [Impatiens glandulifera]
MASLGETTMRTYLSASNDIACPKPRRLVTMNTSINDQIWSSRCNHQGETSESKVGSELLDIILSKGNCGADYGNQMASSPPYYCGSPPSRASNPLIQDSEFGNMGVFCPFSPTTSPSNSSSACTGVSCFSTKIVHKPAAVRIEGFDCLNRNRRNCSISAVA